MPKSRLSGIAWGSACRTHCVTITLPQAGTLALFLSADMPHEVLPATRERLSLTGWFRRRGNEVW